MHRVTETNWSGLIGPNESPVAFLLRKQVPAYVKVHREHQAVYCRQRRLVGSDGLQMPFVGFEEDALFLRLGDVGLAEIVATGSFHACDFSHDGYLIPRPYERKEFASGRYSTKEYGPIVHPRLARFEFDHAVIINKKHRNAVLASAPPIQWPPVEQFALTIEFREADLYVAGTDLASLSSGVREGREPAPYPFDHANRMPGLYATFQAAYALNHAKEWTEFDESAVTSWIQKTAGLPRISTKCAKFAAKMARLSVARTQGGKSKPLKTESLVHLVDNPDHFRFEFVSEGLTLLLAVADWWETLLSKDPDSTRVDLAKKLSELNFSAAEIVEAVKLISGAGLNAGELKEFAGWQDLQIRAAELRRAKEASNRF
jgi:hypothetical protein